MTRSLHLLYLPVLLALGACSSDDLPGRDDSESADPALRATYTPAELVGLVALDEVARVLAPEIVSGDCEIAVYELSYDTLDAVGGTTPASGVMMVPRGSASSCGGPRPILLYARGTSVNRNLDLANLRENPEALLMAAVFASDGYIVVAPNYVGYDLSTAGYHPYLNAAQQSKDMIDALADARGMLPARAAPATTASSELFVAGYSQGGHVAMATHRAMQAAGQAVTASAPMSGPYALSAFGDAIFQGQVTDGGPENLVLLIGSYERAYADIYSSATDVFEAQFAPGIETLLPSTTSLGELKTQGKLPRDALFSPTPPDPAYAGYTPATAPAVLAPIFARGFGSPHLLTNAFRLAYLQDADANPDGGYPVISDGLPPANPANTFRRALKVNDLRNWIPTAPMLLCAGRDDPSVLFLNTALMQNYWASTTTVSVLDLETPIASGDPFADQKEDFAIAKEVVRATGGDSEVLKLYHAALVGPFCLSAVKDFFETF